MKVKNRKKVGILSVGRTDYSYFKPILQEIIKSRSPEYFLIVAGMHLSSSFGSTYKEITGDGFHIDGKIAATHPSDSPEGVAKTISLMTSGMAAILKRNKLDALVILGDRFETLGAAAAAIPYNIPIAHICGGDVTEGLFDEQIRHAITKIAHIHFVTNKLSARRIIQMGEEKWRVFNVGSPSIDLMKQIKLYPRREFFKIHGLDVSRRLFLVTFHPVTLESENTGSYLGNLIKALGHFDANIIITYPNSDPTSRVIIRNFKEFAQKNKNVRFVKSLGPRGYFSTLKYSDVMIGNSSSGIIEAATFQLPIVDIGNMQKSRMAGKNVIHARYDAQDIIRKIEKSLTPRFKNSLKNLQNPYGKGGASKRIIMILRRILTKKTKKQIITKKFSLIK